MSASRPSELSAAVHDRLVQCTPTEALNELAQYVGAILSIAPSSSREVARGLFLAMVDRAVAKRVIGEPVGRGCE